MQELLVAEQNDASPDLEQILNLLDYQLLVHPVKAPVHHNAPEASEVEADFLGGALEQDKVLDPRLSARRRASASISELMSTATTSSKYVCNPRKMFRPAAEV